VVASLWKIPDEQTCDLMMSFYNRLVRGMSRGSALRAAQLEHRRKNPSPFYWGALVCFGETGAVSGMERAAGGETGMNNKSAEKVRAAIQGYSSLIKREPFVSRDRQ